MAYILEKMLTVRAHREDRALNHVVQSKAALGRAQIAKNEKEREFSEYQKWRLHEEQRLFNNLKNEPARVQDLMHFKDTVNTLRRDQNARAQKVEDADKQVAQAEGDLKAARRRHVEACRKKAKIEEHKSVWMEDHRRQVEQDADKEMEELGQPHTLPI